MFLKAFASVAVVSAGLAASGAEAGAATPPTLVKDINSGSLGAVNGAITPAGQNAYFVAFDPVHGRALWRSDGTAAGTRMVKDANGSGVPNPTELAAVGSELYFSADDGVHGRELWKSNGTAAGTRMVKDVFHGHGSSNP